jgi:hypothetical protein
MINPPDLPINIANCIAGLVQSGSHTTFYLQEEASTVSNTTKFSGFAMPRAMGKLQIP